MGNVDRGTERERGGGGKEGDRIPLINQVGHVDRSQTCSQVVTDAGLVIGGAQAVVELSGHSIIAESDVVKYAGAGRKSGSVRSITLRQGGILRRSQTVKHVVRLPLTGTEARIEVRHLLVHEGHDAREGRNGRRRTPDEVYENLALAVGKAGAFQA